MKPLEHCGEVSALGVVAVEFAAIVWLISKFISVIFGD